MPTTSTSTSAAALALALAVGAGGGVALKPGECPDGFTCLDTAAIEAASLRASAGQPVEDLVAPVCTRTVDGVERGCVPRTAGGLDMGEACASIVEASAWATTTDANGICQRCATWERIGSALGAGGLVACPVLPEVNP